MGSVSKGLRQAKHAAFLAKKKLRPSYIKLRSSAFSAYSTAVPFRFSLGRYKDPKGAFPFDFFLHRNAPEGWVVAGTEPSKRLWAVWAGSNPLTPNRRRSLAQLREINSDLEVTLVTPENLEDFIVPGHPLHESFPRLSTNHQSDYLRAYLLHYYGGAYADIKIMNAPFGPAIADLDSSTWVKGYPEIDSDIVANLHGPVGDDVRRNHSRIIGIGALAALPRTRLTAEWLAEVERRVDYHDRLLHVSPAQDPFGMTGGYPVTWIGLGANVFEPLQLKYLPHVATDPRLTPVMTEYR